MLALRGSDAGLSALAYEACYLWCLGYPDQAAERSRVALEMARQLDHSLSLVEVLCYAGCLFNAQRRDANGLYENSEALIQLSTEKNFSGWLDTGIYSQGEALILLGEVQKGLNFVRQGLESNKSQDVLCYQTVPMGFLAVGYNNAGLLADGLTTLNQALDLVEATSEHHWESELLRLKAELLLEAGKSTEAETCLLASLAVARRQHARSWELRTACDLARLWHQAGRSSKALELLKPVYDWFTEGFDTPDLVEARRILAEIKEDPAKNQ